MDHKRVIDELIQGKEFAKQLRIHLNNSTSSYEVQEILIHNILNSYDKSLSFLTTHGVNLNGSNNESHSHFGTRVRRMESQAPLSRSPYSGFSDHDQFKDPSHEIFSSKSICRKSSDESTQKLKNQVKVSGDMGFQEALDDGYSWRKYGQKDILGAKHPRGYYRCTNRQAQGCLATKQVQKVDDATIIFDITYHGSHTCNPASSTPQLEFQKQPSQQKQVLQSPENILTFKTENLESPLYHLPSTSPFNRPTYVNTIYRPTTPRSTYFTISQPRAGLGQKDENPVVLETELDHIVSAATSFKSSLNDDAGFTFGEPGFGNDINFDDSTFF